MSLSSRMRAAAFVVLALAAPAAAGAQAVIKVNDSVSVKLGFLSQMWADFNQNVRTDSSYSQTLFLRRIRLLVGAQVGSKVNVFLDTDAPNLGRTTGTTAGKALGSQVIIQDAWVELKPGSTNALLLTAGLQFVPLCRNCVSNGALLLPVDYSSYAFLQSGPTGSSAGRDVGVQAKGYFAGGRVEYRAGVFSGARQANAAGQFTSSNSLRGAGRLQVELLEPEAPVYSYAGTYFGKKKVLAIGGGVDAQSSYTAVAADAFLSYPLGDDGVTAQANFVHYDGDTFFGAALPRQSTFEVEGGYHFNGAKLTPFVKFEARNVDDAQATTTANLDEHRLQLGGTYYMAGHNLNVKAAYTRGTLDRLPVLGVAQSPLTQNGFTMQLQGFYF